MRTFATLALLLLISTQTFPKTIMVVTEADSINGSLRNAISSASNGDSISFAQGLSEIVLGSQISIGKSLTIKGNPNLIIRCNGSGAIFPRVFEITGESPINVKIESLHLIKTGYHIGDTVSYDTNGGIILIRNTKSILDINSCYFTTSGGFGGTINCSGAQVNGQNGGAIAQYGGTLNIQNSTFSGLEAGGSKYWGAGGAICHFGGTMNIINSTFFNNSAGKNCQNTIGNGAAIYTQDGTATITSCTFAKQRTSFNWWVGLTNYSGHTHSVSIYNSNLTIKNSLFYSNQSYDIKGSFYTGGYNIFEQTITTSDKTTIFTSNPGFRRQILSTNSDWIPVFELDAAGLAIDALPPDGNGAPQLDQRGHARVNRADIGACEFEGCIPNEVKASWASSAFGQDSWVSDMSVVNDSVIWVKDMNADSISISVNGGVSWISKPLPKYEGFPRAAGGICALSETKAYYILSVSDSKGIYKTTDGGETWTKQPSGFNQNSPFPDIVHFWNENDGVAIGDADPNQNFEIYTTDNGGANWNLVSGGNMPNGNKEATSNGQSTYRVIGNAIFFITSTGRIFKSLDKGLTWSVVNTPFYNTPLAASTITFDFKDNNNGLVAYCSTDETSYKIYRTTNGGQTWDSLSSNNFNQHIKYISTTDAYFSMSPGGGLSYSCDDGQTWINISWFDNVKTRIAACSPMGKIFFGGQQAIYTSNQVLTASPANLLIAAQANSTKTFEIVSNTNWTVSSNEAWLHPDIAYGSGNSTITLTAQANSSAVSRTATVTVAGNGFATRTILVEQEGKPSAIGQIARETYAIYPNPVKEMLYFDSNSQPSKISVFDSRGNLVIKEMPVINHINVSSLTTGLYFIRIVGLSETAVLKFLKE